MGGSRLCHKEWLDNRTQSVVLSDVASHIDLALLPTVDPKFDRPRSQCQGPGATAAFDREVDWSRPHYQGPSATALP